MTSSNWNTIIWQQFGATIDMLGNAIEACPNENWSDNVWDDASDVSAYTEFWFIAFHTIFWLDLYLSGARRKGFSPPPPFLNGILPEEPYTKEQLLDYLQQCRRKCEQIFDTFTDEKANQPCEFPWGEAVSFAELQLYNMRHVQEHAAQLSLHIGGKVDAKKIGWVARASHTHS